MKTFISTAIVSFAFLSASTIFADAALEDANRVRRQSQEYNRDLQVEQNTEAQFDYQNEQNQRADTSFDRSDSLEVEPPAPLWNSGPGY